MMTEQQFNALVREHADAWRRVGEANPSLCFDPARDFYLHAARECSEKLIKAFAERRP